MDSKSILIIDNIEVMLDSHKILDGVSMKVEEGELLAIIGPNGAGKTTLLRTIASILKPYKGVILIDGKNVHQLKSREISKILAYVPTEVEVITEIRVLELLLISRLIRTNKYWESSEDINVINKVLEILNIEHLKSRKLSELSSGERQRVFIARALVQEPRILLLDEPTSHLDLHYSVEIMNLLRNIARSGLVVIFTTHDVNIASLYADKVVVLKNGRVRAMGKPQKVLNEELIKEVYGVKVIRIYIKDFETPLFIPIAPHIRME